MGNEKGETTLHRAAIAGDGHLVGTLIDQVHTKCYMLMQGSTAETGLPVLMKRFPGFGYCARGLISTLGFLCFMLTQQQVRKLNIKLIKINLYKMYSTICFNNVVYSLHYCHARPM